MTNDEVLVGMSVVITEKGIERAMDKFGALSSRWKEYFTNHIGEIWIVSGSDSHHYIGITYHFSDRQERTWVVPAIMLDPISCSDECNAQSDITVLFSGGGG